MNPHADNIKASLVLFIPLSPGSLWETSTRPTPGYGAWTFCFYNLSDNISNLSDKLAEILLKQKTSVNRT
ncbi:MAG: hypothetical protein ACTS5Y_05515, partial [Pollutimonas bauzanensis]